MDWKFTETPHPPTGPEPQYHTTGQCTSCGNTFIYLTSQGAPTPALCNACDAKARAREADGKAR